MVKGVAVRLESYDITIPKLLKIIKFDDEIKKHEVIVLKPDVISGEPEESTRIEHIEPIIKFCMENKNPGTELFIAEGCDGNDTAEVFEDLGYTELAEKYGIGLIDLNNTETEEVRSNTFLSFESIHYPSILRNSFVVSVPRLREDNSTTIAGATASMRGVFPARHYRGFLSATKSKLKKIPIDHQIHDIIQCKEPNFAIIDASEKGLILAGQAIEMDKQAAKALGLDWGSVAHLKHIEETRTLPKDIDKEVDELIGVAE